MKIHKSLKITLYCAVLFLFIGGIIAVSEQTKSELKNNTAVMQNKTLNQPINPAQPTGQMINPFSGNPVNTTEIENVTIVKNGTFDIPKGLHGMAFAKAVQEAQSKLHREVNLTQDEWMRTECNATSSITGKCTYQIIKS